MSERTVNKATSLLVSKLQGVVPARAPGPRTYIQPSDQAPLLLLLLLLLLIIIIKMIMIQIMILMMMMIIITIMITIVIVSHHNSE